jgi:hypothetical protein
MYMLSNTHNALAMYAGCPVRKTSGGQDPRGFGALSMGSMHGLCDSSRTTAHVHSAH